MKENIIDDGNILISTVENENFPLKDNKLEIEDVDIKIKPVYAKKPYPPNKLIITSEFFIDGFPPLVFEKDYLKKISPVHLVLSKMNEKNYPSINDVQIRILTRNYIDDFVILLSEYSPEKYDGEYFKKFFEKTNTHIAFGAFIEICGIEYLIGYCLGHLCREKTFFQNVKKIYRTKSCQRSCIDFFRMSPENYGLIKNIGVIDEYRKMGLGKKLLMFMENELKQRGALGIMAHIIEHNCSAIKFFECCNWKYGGFISKYYNFGGNLFDGLVYYKILFYESEFDEVEHRGLNEPQIDRQYKIIRFCRYLKKIVTH